MFYSHWEKNIHLVLENDVKWISGLKRKKSLLKVVLFPPSSLSQAPFAPLPQQ